MRVLGRDDADLLHLAKKTVAVIGYADHWGDQRQDSASDRTSWVIAHTGVDYGTLTC